MRGHVYKPLENHSFRSKHGTIFCWFVGLYFDQTLYPDVQIMCILDIMSKLILICTKQKSNRSDTPTVVLWINVAPSSTMSPKTTDVLSFLINLGGAPELSSKLIISNTTMVLNTIKFEREFAFPFDVAPIFCYIAAFIGTCRTA
jgi:hypothetical protein